MNKWWKTWGLVMGLFILLFQIAACSQQTPEDKGGNLQDVPFMNEENLTLPELEPLDLNDRHLKVTATTSIIGDVVAKIGGDKIELTTLMAPGQDPHTYEPSAGELTTVSQSDIIFINGWGLEENLGRDLTSIANEIPIVTVNANVRPLEFDHDGEEEHEGENDNEHGVFDPHTWLAVPNVEQWVNNIVTVLGELDPANSSYYEQNGADYSLQLRELDKAVIEQIATIPSERRILITNHNSFGYFAETYGFQVAGTVMSSSSTLADPSARELADTAQVMERLGLCTIFTESTVSDRLPQALAQELKNCDQVQVIQLYTGSIGLPGSGADSYLGMMQYDVDNIVRGLR